MENRIFRFISGMQVSIVTGKWELVGVELGVLDCPGAHRVSCLLRTRVIHVGIKQL